MTLIYLVEDDENLKLVLTSYLEREGWVVEGFGSAEAAMGVIDKTPDLWVLDIMLPGMDGYEFIKEIKKRDSQTPVIFISARDRDIDRVVGLELGSEDYLPKPFLPRELVIRVSNLLSRKGRGDENEIEFGAYVISPKKRLVSQNGKAIELTGKEFDLLYYFVQNSEIMLSRDMILNHVWGEDYFGSDRVVDDMVRKLRKKLPNIKIETVYGYGYRVIVK